MADIVDSSLTISLDLMYENRSEAMIVEDNDTKHKCKVVKKMV